jgi:predicted  nucleic acid-binding Zn-ribbon protein
MSMDEPCQFCGHAFDHEKLGKYGCPNCESQPSKPQTVAQRQEALRARRLMLGQTEVRGIYLHPDQHAELKAYARKLAKKAEKRGNDAAGSRTEPSGSEAD